MFGTSYAHACAVADTDNFLVQTYDSDSRTPIPYSSSDCLVVD